MEEPKILSNRPVPGYCICGKRISLNKGLCMNCLEAFAIGMKLKEEQEAAELAAEQS